MQRRVRRHGTVEGAAMERRRAWILCGERGAAWVFILRRGEETWDRGQEIE